MQKLKLKNGEYTLLDDEDYSKFSGFVWNILNSSRKHKYVARGARTQGKYRKILLHREILEAPKDLMVDHINGNTLDNRKSNLRLVTRNKNLQNSKLRSDSKCSYKGVRRIKRKKQDKFSARIQIDKNTRLYLGYFDSEKEAALAYNEAAIKHFGEYANLNKLED